MKAGTTAHLRWKCPACGKTYTCPPAAPAFGVTCGANNPGHKDFKTSVEMVSLDPPVNLNPRRKETAA